MPSISVIVPVRNEGRCLEAALRALLTQDFPPSDFEVIVADGCSTDDTVLVVRRLQAEFANLKLLFNPGRVSSAGRNTAIRHASKDVVVVVDGHCSVPDRFYLKNLSEAFASSGADSLGRPQPLDAPNPTPFQSAVSLARSSRLGHNPDSDIFSNEAKFVPPQSTAVAYTPAVFHRIGLFDQAFDACEDVEFNQRLSDANMTCCFTPSVKVVYHPRSSLGGLFFQMARYGMGRARLAFKCPRSLTAPALVPPLWSIWCMLGWLSGLLHEPFAWMWLGSLGFYLLVLCCAGLWLGRKSTAQVMSRLPSIFVAIHFGFAWGFWREVSRQVRIRVFQAKRLPVQC